VYRVLAISLFHWFALGETLARLLLGLSALVLCCGGLFTTTSTARSKRCHASGANSDCPGKVGVLAMPDEPADVRELRTLYCNLMAEIKDRIAVIRFVYERRTTLPDFAAFELCYLQLRMICETIALACLAAHGDIPATREGKLPKTHSADWILGALERLHPQFYPVPGRQLLGPGGRPIAIDKITDEYLTKADLLALYGECHAILHRGAMRTVAVHRKPDFEKINSHCFKITNLLSHHQIQLQNPDHMFWVIMQAKEDGKVHGTLMVTRSSLDT
jgi:hypothetical protein